MRRKGELSPGAVDRGWPHQVIVPDLGHQLWLGRWPSLCERRHTVCVNDRWHQIYCFADEADAVSFREQFRAFGAERFDPRRRGRGARWATVKPA